MVRLGVGQRRRRLVQDEDPALEGERARDLQQLPVRDRQRVASAASGKSAGAARRASPGCARHRAVTQPSASSSSRPAKMLPATVRLGKRQHLLVDHADAALERFPRAAECSRSPRQRMSPASGWRMPGEDLQQRGLPGAVFADRGRAPLRPRRPSNGHAAQRLDRAERLRHVPVLEPRSSSHSLRQRPTLEIVRLAVIAYRLHKFSYREVCACCSSAVRWGSAGAALIAHQSPPPAARPPRREPFLSAPMAWSRLSRFRNTR